MLKLESRHQCCLIFVLTMTGLAMQDCPCRAARTADRILGSYRNDDGTTPDGSDSKRDDTTALRKALAEGPGVVRIGGGFYRCGDVQIPENVALIGSGKGTILRSNGAKSIFKQAGVSDWTLRDLVLDGESAGEWKTRKDEGRSGISVENCRSYEVTGVTARNFAGAGFQFMRNKGHDGATLHALTAIGCYVGIRFDVRAEYMTATQLNCRNNVIGCAVHAGNVSIGASTFSDNIDGMLIEDKDNGSHGTITGCLFNHNERYALFGQHIMNGMAITDCCFFYGTIRLEDCTGVNITSGLVSCSVQTAGMSANRFSGNYVIPLSFHFVFGANEIVEGNFTKAGPWRGEKAK